MNNIDIGNKTIQITRQGYYVIGNQTIRLNPGAYSEVEVYSPERIRELVNGFSADAQCSRKGMVQVISADSYEAAKGYDHVMVMNFANAVVPGGGFRLGATAQEEALCRNSTLYASISSEKADEMYRYNRLHPSAIPSEYMLFTKNVCVFRDAHCRLLEIPYNVSVITIPAPNRRGMAMFTGKAQLKAVMEERIRIMLQIAIEQKCENVVLGAWGCGAFGHHAKDVADYFRTILSGENYKSFFDNVIFAILNGDRDGKLKIFEEALLKGENENE